MCSPAHGQILLCPSALTQGRCQASPALRSNHPETRKSHISLAHYMPRVGKSCHVCLPNTFLMLTICSFKIFSVSQLSQDMTKTSYWSIRLFIICFPNGVFLPMPQPISIPLGSIQYNVPSPRSMGLHAIISNSYNQP